MGEGKNDDVDYRIDVYDDDDGSDDDGKLQAKCKRSFGGN